MPFSVQAYQLWSIALLGIMIALWWPCGGRHLPNLWRSDHSTTFKVLVTLLNGFVILMAVVITYITFFVEGFL